MRLRLTMPVAASADTKDMLQQHKALIEDQELTHNDTQVPAHHILEQSGHGALQCHNHAASSLLAMALHREFGS